MYPTDAVMRVSWYRLVYKFTHHKNRRGDSFVTVQNLSALTSVRNAVRKQKSIFDGKMTAIAAKYHENIGAGSKAVSAAGRSMVCMWSGVYNNPLLICC